MTTAGMFAENRDDMSVTPILPAGVTSLAQLPSANVSAFSRAVSNDVQPAIMPAAPANDGERIANDAIGVGNTLRAPAAGIRAQQSDVGFLFGSVMSSAVEMAGVDLNGNGVPDELEQRATPMPAPQMSAPSPSGFGGGPG